MRLARRGRDAADFASALAAYAARAVKSGRRLCGQEPAGDVLSPLAQQRRNFSVSALPEASSLDGNVFDEALFDNTRTAVPEQVSFRLDFPRWRKSRTRGDRQLIDQLMVGERTQDVAGRFKISPARVSQLRRDFHQDWQRFHGELATA